MNESRRKPGKGANKEMNESYNDEEKIVRNRKQVNEKKTRRADPS